MISEVPHSAALLEDRLARARARLAEIEAAYQPVTMAQLVAQRARTHASVVAIDVFDRDERLTYAQLDALANRYAHALQQIGIAKGDRLGVMLPNRIEFPVLWCACAKLGAVMVSINIRYTAREIEYVVTDTQAKAMIVDESAIGTWPAALDNNRPVPVDEFVELAQAASEDPVVADVGLDDLLNIAYTSGTTGFPKGCMLTHGYWSLLSLQSTHWDFGHQRVLCACPFFYTDGPRIFSKSLRNGATFFLSPGMSSTRFLDWIRKLRIDWCGMPELITTQPADADAVASLKQVGHYGSWSPERIRAFRERFGDVPGQDGYAMVEVGWATQLPPDIPEMADTGTIGIPTLFREVRLVDDDGRDVPPGEPGEAWVRGPWTLQGYWNKPEATAECFEGKWFKTGDVLVRDEAGFHWFVGRKKEVIRRSSENISAREVESVIRGLSPVEDVAAVPVPDAMRGEEVKVCIELKAGKQPSDLPVERILTHARERLAVFKVPRYIAYVAQLPRTSTSHKVLKRELTAVSDPLAGVYDAQEQRWR
ncbi:MAG: acyl--CoA ligase [Ideonella sp.]|nr:acyl--CoA ligase [Ideonella sp.]